MEQNNRKKTGIPDLSSLVYGKVPPQNIKSEESILGCIMLEVGVYEIVSEIITAECFYKDNHQRIFRSFQRLFKKHIHINLVSVMDELRSTEELDSIGGAYALTGLTNAVVSSAAVVDWARAVYQSYLKREIIINSGENINDAYDDTVDAFDLVSRVEGKLRTITANVSQLNRIKVSNVAAKVFDKFVTRVYNAKNNIIDPNVVYTGIRDWDEFNGPLFRGGVYIVAARPGMGKGVLMTQMLCNMGKKTRVGVCNGEMTSEQLVIRVGCNLLGLDNELWKKEAADITEEEIQQVNDAMVAAQDIMMEIEDSNDIDKVRTKMYVWVKVLGVKAIFLDFITMYRCKTSKRFLDATQQAEYVMDILATTAKELDVPIIAFAQLNRESITKGNVREPNLSDLKRAGEIEEKAFQVVFLHRPEYYTPDQGQDEMGESIKGLLYMICCKHRDGKTFRLKKKFDGASSRIEPWTSDFPAFTPVTNMRFTATNYIAKPDVPFEQGYQEETLF